MAGAVLFGGQLSTIQCPQYGIFEWIPRDKVTEDIEKG